MRRSEQKIAAIFEQAATNWAAYVPDLPGCLNIREAISGHIQTLREFGEPVPEATSVAKEIEITPAA